MACKTRVDGERQQEVSEAIHSNLVLRLDEVEEALLQGFWNVMIDKKTVRAYVRAPFLAYAILHMKLRHWQD